MPGKKAEKGYVLLREVLKKTGKVGIGRVVIRTREYLAAVDAAGRCADADPAALPAGDRRRGRVQAADGQQQELPGHAKELEMAKQLIESMASNGSRTTTRTSSARSCARSSTSGSRDQTGKKVRAHKKDEAAPAAATTQNVVDFMELLKRSLDQGWPQGRQEHGQRAASSSKERARKPAVRERRSRRRKTG